MRRLTPLFLIFAACASTHPTARPAAVSQQCNPGHSILNATLWVQSGAEYRAVTTQTFQSARRALDEALADPTRVGALEETNDDPTQPPAMIVDMDETVVDNTGFEARVIQAGKTYDSKTWKEWTASSAALAVPGATELLAYAKSRGVTVFYLTNRDEDERPGTRRNVEQLGFPLDPHVETILLRQDVSDKAPRRAQVAASYRVLLVMGDDLNDFANMREATWEERNALVTKMQDWWGTRWFMLPNPMYGSWERAAIGPGGTPCEQVERKVNVLKP